MRRFTFAAGVLFALAMLLASGGTVQAQCSPGRPGLFHRKVRYMAPPTCGTVNPGPAASGLAASGDAAGFLAWLNATRASYGLPAVGYSVEVEASCHENNRHQAVRGMGHHFMGCHRRQNAAWNCGWPGVETMWMNSPGHRSALLDPTIRVVGIAWYGAYCTFGGS